MDFYAEIEAILQRLDQLQSHPEFKWANQYLTNHEDLNLYDGLNSLQYALNHRNSIERMERKQCRN